MEDAIGNLYRFVKGFWIVNGVVASTVPVVPLVKLVEDDR